MPTAAPPLEDVNQQFHDSYDRARDDARTKTPILVVLADTVSLLVGDVRRAIEFSPELFHVIKAVVHAPIAAFVGAGDALQARIERSRAALVGDDEAARRLRRILDLTLAFVRDPEADRDTFAAAMGPLLLESTDDATALQLRALDRAAKELLGSLDDDAREAVQVVVAGAHQARARSLGMQYFAKLLGDDASERLTYAESIETEAEAVQLIATRNIDRVIGRAFFGEEKRLERDILGDSVEAQLGAFEATAKL